MNRKRALAVVAILSVVVVAAAVAASFVLGLGNQVASHAPVGVSAGGAQDGTAFRANVENGYVPQPTDVAYEGIYHDYYFDVGSGGCERRFCPTYSRAASPDPLTDDTDRYVAVGLTSGVRQTAFERPNVTLVVVVDTSGSMDEAFSSYHYDGESTGKGSAGERGLRKIEAARRAVETLSGRLGPEDRLGVVAYDDSARVVQPVRSADAIDERRLAARLDGLDADGGTRLSAGMARARAMARADESGANRTTRVVYLTDAMPNQGELSADALEKRLSTDADRGVYTTFVGVGVDFNSALTDSLGSVRGANYYTVDSPAAFEERMSDGFAYMVTPLAYNLTVSVDAPDHRVVEAYGTPSTTDRLVHVATLFPSRSTDNGTEGSVVLVELERTASDPQPLKLRATWADPDGDRHAVTRTVELPESAPHYDSTGVRKAVALTRYGTLLRNWAAHERAVAGDEEFDPPDGVDHRDLSRWEQRPVELSVTPPYDERVERFRTYFAAEQRALGAERMDRDLAILGRLADEAGTNGGRADPVRESPRGGRPTPAGTTTGVTVGSIGTVPALVGLANLVVTVAVAAYGVGQKHRSRRRDGDGEW